MEQCQHTPDVPPLVLGACSDQEMILIVEGFQGRTSRQVEDGKHHHRRVCRYAAGDCVEPVTAELRSRLFRSCVGRSRCSVVVDIGWMHSCKSFADYIQVVYQCIPSSFTHCLFASDILIT